MSDKEDRAFAERLSDVLIETVDKFPEDDICTTARAVVSLNPSMPPYLLVAFCRPCMALLTTSVTTPEQKEALENLESLIDSKEADNVLDAGIARALHPATDIATSPLRADWIRGDMSALELSYVRKRAENIAIAIATACRNNTHPANIWSVSPNGPARDGVLFDIADYDWADCNIMTDVVVPYSSVASLLLDGFDTTATLPYDDQFSVRSTLVRTDDGDFFGIVYYDPDRNLRLFVSNLAFDGNLKPYHSIPNSTIVNHSAKGIIDDITRRRLASQTRGTFYGNPSGPEPVAGPLIWSDFCLSRIPAGDRLCIAGTLYDESLLPNNLAITAGGEALFATNAGEAHSKLKAQIRKKPVKWLLDDETAKKFNMTPAKSEVARSIVEDTLKRINFYVSFNQAFDRELELTPPIFGESTLPASRPHIFGPPKRFERELYRRECRRLAKEVMQYLIDDALNNIGSTPSFMKWYYYMCSNHIDEMKIICRRCVEGDYPDEHLASRVRLVSVDELTNAPAFYSGWTKDDDWNRVTEAFDAHPADFDIWGKVTPVTDNYPSPHDLTIDKSRRWYQFEPETLEDIEKMMPHYNGTSRLNHWMAPDATTDVIPAADEPDWAVVANPLSYWRMKKLENKPYLIDKTSRSYIWPEKFTEYYQLPPVPTNFTVVIDAD